MAGTPFHPLVEAWFRERVGEPTEPQALGWPHIAAGRHTLIAAPTGSGKTFAAFLVCIDALLKQAVDGTLPETTQVVYISPLKALSNDIRRNLESPLAEIQERAAKEGLLIPPIRAMVRTGDTPQHERAAMLRKPPHILVTTPESLYLLLTSPKSRGILSDVRTVIVDEIHALARDKRGSHLALSLERLDAACGKPPVRIGLSATQKPIAEIGKFLTGGQPCSIVDVGHRRELDLAVEVPPSELSAVCSNEQWDEIYKRMGELIAAHRSTLVFVNTRRLAERVAHRLREALGEQAVAAHHGSLSREIRLEAEERLKKGELKAIVATASLELGIDIGFIDLVCQVGSPRSIATFLQRVGRSGHRLGVVPKGRLFAMTRDELIEGYAILRAVKHGRLDAVEIPVAPLDILEQQLVAEVSARDWPEDELFALVRRSWPYRDLKREDFDRIVTLASEGIAKGRKEGAYIHRDSVNKVLKARRAARLTALTGGGAIPETADYRVVTEDDGTFVGTVNEDFAIESQGGDVFLLGNTSWRIRYVRGGQVVVRDAQGAPASVPFWLGEAPGRTIELSEEVSSLREEIGARCDRPPDAAAWLKEECGADAFAAAQAVNYVASQKAAVGFIPTQKRILFERFFDESGGMELVVHAPFGSRINRAWGLAMRKRFCRTFDFELQASADDNGVVLSLGPQHSFPIDAMFKLLHPDSARDHLIQALLAAPMFQVRWRWNVTRALAVLRMRSGKKVPPPLQRFRSDDLMTSVFPLQTACFEHRPPDVPVPDHPLIAQTLYDCLHEAMDVDRWEDLLEKMQKGEIALEGRDTTEPSPFSHSILNANPYAFLDDAPLEERRARAVAVRRMISPDDVRDLARLDPEAIKRVRAEAWPLVRDAEELHDALLSMVAFPAEEGKNWAHWMDSLVQQKRALVHERPGLPALWVPVERWPLPPTADIVRGRLEVVGPTTAKRISEDLGLELSEISAALAVLEAEGFCLQGKFTDSGETEWCERRLLARIHRLTLKGARERVKPVPPEVYWRFLSEFHHVLPGFRRDGTLGLHETVGQLQGFEAAAGAWEMDLLPARVEKYRPEWLDYLSFSGQLVWGRMRPPVRSDEEEPQGGALTRVVPITLAFREDMPWLLPEERAQNLNRARPQARSVYEALLKNGALFFHDLLEVTGYLPTQLEDALSELATLGFISADGFSAIRSLAQKKHERPGRSRWGRRRPSPQYGQGGRWTLFPGRVAELK